MHERAFVPRQVTNFMFDFWQLFSKYKTGNTDWRVIVDTLNFGNVNILELFLRILNENFEALIL